METIVEERMGCNNLVFHENHEWQYCYDVNLNKWRDLKKGESAGGKRGLRCKHCYIPYNCHEHKHVFSYSFDNFSILGGRASWREVNLENRIQCQQCYRAILLPSNKLRVVLSKEIKEIIKRKNSELEGLSFDILLEYYNTECYNETEHKKYASHNWVTDESIKILDTENIFCLNCKRPLSEPETNYGNQYHCGEVESS